MSEFGACSEFVLCMKEELGYWEGVVLTGWSITYKEHTVLLIVRASKNKTAVCCFIECEELVDCFRVLWRWMHSKNSIKWTPDRFAKK